MLAHAGIRRVVVVIEVIENDNLLSGQGSEEPEEGYVGRVFAYPRRESVKH